MTVPEALTARAYMLKHNSIIEAEVVTIRADCMAAYSVEFDSRPSEFKLAVSTMEEALKFTNNGHISERTAVEFMHRLDLSWKNTRGKNGMYVDGMLERLLFCKLVSGHERADVLIARHKFVESMLPMWFNTDIQLLLPVAPARSNGTLQEQECMECVDFHKESGTILPRTQVLVFQDESMVRNFLPSTIFVAV